MAIPNAAITFIIATLLQGDDPDGFNEDGTSNAAKFDHEAKAAQLVIATFTAIMIFVLYNRSRTSYNRWWEGGTLLQKTRGEWFNAYSSIMAFTSTKPSHKEQVEEYCHLIARLMSLLMCCGLQQVSPNRDRPFEIIDLAGIEPESVEFLNQAPDKVEVLLQWIQRSMIVQAERGILSAAPPILSRAFQEISRGIVNLQNARKIADFPYPYPLAQVCMILQLMHWAMTPVAAALALPRLWAVALAFFSIFVLWCIHFNALDLEFPFGARVNDLPMDAFQQDWNKSIITLLDDRATRPPGFEYDSKVHTLIDFVMSDATAFVIPAVPLPLDKGMALIKIGEDMRDKKKKKHSKTYRRSSMKPPTGSSGLGAMLMPMGTNSKTPDRPMQFVRSASSTVSSTPSTDSINLTLEENDKRRTSLESTASRNSENNKSTASKPPDIPGNHQPPDGINSMDSTAKSSVASSGQGLSSQNSQPPLLAKPPMPKPLTLDTPQHQAEKPLDSKDISLFEDLVADERSNCEERRSRGHIPRNDRGH